MSLKHTLEFARHEVQQLRQRNEILEARDEVVRLFTALIMPRTPQGAGEDIVWRIGEELRRLETDAADTRRTPAAAGETEENR